MLVLVARSVDTVLDTLVACGVPPDPRSSYLDLIADCVVKHRCPFLWGCRAYCVNAGTRSIDGLGYHDHVLMCDRLLCM